MRRSILVLGITLIAVPMLLVPVGCGKVHAQEDAVAAGAPPEAKIVPFSDPSLFGVDHPEQFPLAAATEHPTTSELVVTGTVTPDVSRSVPVVSLASGPRVAVK